LLNTLKIIGEFALD